MSVELTIRRYANGEPNDEFFNYRDTEDEYYGYLFNQHGGVSILHVRKPKDPEKLREVTPVRHLSSEGYLEVAGTRLENSMGFTTEDVRAMFDKP
ncbi:hypothetical protein ARZXY2_2498 [Arthrobacter sp. ZXY-2]|nr:hypothetical protein ARZXY2_2498 [Arthrobacter sp. ZXY-2]